MNSWQNPVMAPFPIATEIDENGEIIANSKSQDIHAIVNFEITLIQMFYLLRKNEDFNLEVLTGIPKNISSYDIMVVEVAKDLSLYNLSASNDWVKKSRNYYLSAGSIEDLRKSLEDAVCRGPFQKNKRVEIGYTFNCPSPYIFSIIKFQIKDMPDKPILILVVRLPILFNGGQRLGHVFKEPNVLAEKCLYDSYVYLAELLD